MPSEPHPGLMWREPRLIRRDASRATPRPLRARPAGVALVLAAGAAACANVVGIQSFDPAIDGRGGAFCQAASRAASSASLFFCDDFDDGGLPAPWNSSYESGGTLAVDDAAASSSPASLDLVVDPLPAGQLPNVSLRALVAAPTSPVQMAFGFSLDPVRIDPGTSASIVIAAIDFLDPSQNRYTIQLAFNVQSGAATTELDELFSGGRPYVPHAIAAPLGTGTFTDVAIQIDWTAPQAATASVLFGGASVLSVPLAISVQATTLQLSIGTTYASTPSPGWELRYDDVLFTAT